VQGCRGAGVQGCGGAGVQGHEVRRSRRKPTRLHICAVHLLHLLHPLHLESPRDLRRLRWGPVLGRPILSGVWTADRCGRHRRCARSRRGQPGRITGGDPAGFAVSFELRVLERLAQFV
jgi:hypothetical protein